ncbi:MULTISPECIES: conjugal transfer protein TraG N-terminal domain-containing protein [Pectobacterium]|uniref:conjugal transfer protein TraG N-terminal domain-containing protein n=1 Tax=Pectobacterium TaxID=122277 RepID=UPI000CD1B0FA|nr:MULTISPECIES: conjugal transfer protein TraG N-terminal domain-containing protein [Pectobacterium]MBN3228208.1 conjugal transfer protein TraG N-terminal domain-containing protein [Pectobacterium brasiliense]MCA6943766.1 conjugal transfer protein TraG N-terminal domain-containing protein [Pectobacterium polaris]MCA6959319.1 conjugal transfer protein TraG N-terminal domain-containing protein [Pectobacterium polaris]MCL6375477.1 conjugal transfer protein TraG [Pectobacterium atrosepticum]POD92
MTLFTTDYLEYYLTLVSWIVHNGIWAVLVSSGVFVLPFVAIIIDEWLRSRTEGADEGNKGVLSSMRIENRVWVAIVVVMFAGIPFIDVDLNTIRYDQARSAQCQISVPQPEDTGWSQSFSTLNNQSAKVPVWWAFMHALSRAITGASVAAIPCGTDLRQMRMEINATRIDDPILAQEVADFTHDCYGPARAKLFMNRPDLGEAQMHDVTWIGSTYFVSTGGFYDTYRAKTPREGWAYDSTRDAGLAQVPSGAGYPSCRQWWSDGGNGLRARLLAQVDPSLLSRIANWAGFISRAEVDDSVIRALASPRQQKLNQGSVYTDYGGQIDKTLPNIVTRAAGDIGMTIGGIAAFPALDVVRQALPMVLALLKMALVICIPLVLLVGTYDLKTVVTLSMVQFALFFVDFWFQLARWLDSTILDALYGWGWGWNRPHNNVDPLMGMNNTFGDMLLNFVMGSMFIVLPAFWIGALAWAGIRAGTIANSFSAGTKDAGNAGGKGAGTVSQKLK